MSGELRIHLSEDDADSARLAELTGYLRSELRQLDVDDVSARLITAALAAVGTALIMVSEARDPVNLSGPGCVILIVAAVSSLVMAFLLLRGWIRSRAAADR
jgi:hypothetical protein